MRHHISYENDGGVFHRIRQGGVRGSEKPENRLKECQNNAHKQQSNDGVEGDCVAQDLVCVFVVFLSQQHGNHSG